MQYTMNPSSWFTGSSGSAITSDDRDASQDHPESAPLYPSGPYSPTDRLGPARKALTLANATTAGIIQSDLPDFDARQTAWERTIATLCGALVSRLTAFSGDSYNALRTPMELYHHVAQPLFLQDNLGARVASELRMHADIFEYALTQLVKQAAEEKWANPQWRTGRFKYPYESSSLTSALGSGVLGQVSWDPHGSHVVVGSTWLTDRCFSLRLRNDNLANVHATASKLSDAVVGGTVANAAYFRRSNGVPPADIIDSRDAVQREMECWLRDLTDEAGDERLPLSLPLLTAGFAYVYRRHQDASASRRPEARRFPSRFMPGSFPGSENDMSTSAAKSLCFEVTATHPGTVEEVIAKLDTSLFV